MPGELPVELPVSVVLVPTSKPLGIDNVPVAVACISRNFPLKYAFVPTWLYTLIRFSAWIAYKIVYQLYLYPRFFSPLRHVPGPPLGSLLVGQFGEIIRGEAGIPQRAWVKQYGSMVRVVGPIGIERLIVMNPDTIHKLLVTDWVELSEG